MISKAIIVSPSGNYYGSEQVLLDFLSSTKNKYLVYIPKNGILLKIVQEKTGHQVIGFSFKNLKFLYLRILLKLLKGESNTVYINEAGHIKYILILAKIFPKKKFIIHTRIIEDTYASRWKIPLPKNITVISISEFVQSFLPVPSVLLYDLFLFSKDYMPKSFKNDKLIIGIIGRIALTKGLNKLLDILVLLEEQNQMDFYEFHLYGGLGDDIEKMPFINKLKTFKNVIFKGFKKEKKDIYNQLDCVLHLSKIEPLGRIFLEAIDEIKPFVGFNTGGIGEIGKLAHLLDWLVDDNQENETILLFEKLTYIRENYELCLIKVIESKKNADKTFSSSFYNSTLENLLRG